MEIIEQTCEELSKMPEQDGQVLEQLGDEYLALLTQLRGKLMDLSNDVIQGPYQRRRNFEYAQRLDTYAENVESLASRLGSEEQES